MNMKVLLLLIVCFLGTCILAECPNGCSHVGLCLPNNMCQCPLGRNGSDCSGQTPFVYPKTPYQCPSCYITEVGPAELYFGPSMYYPDNPKSLVNFNGELVGYYSNVNTFVLTSGNSSHSYVRSPYHARALTQTQNDPSAFDGCGAWLNTAISKGNLVHGFYHAEGVPSGSNCDPEHQKSVGYAYSEDGGKTFVKPANNLILSTDREYKGVWGGVGDHGGAYWNDYFYIWYSNAEKLTVGVARSSTGLPGSWYKYKDGAWNSPGVGGDDTPTGAAGQGATVYTPTNTLLMIGGEYRFASPNFFGSNLAASDDGINFEYIGYPLLYSDRQEFGCYGAECKEQVWYFVPVGNTGRNYVDDAFWLYYLYSFPGVGLHARYEARHAVRLTYSPDSNTPAQTRTAVTSYKHLVTGERWDATHLVPGLWVAETILGYSASYSLPNISTTLVVDCYDADNDDHFATKEGACGYQRYRPIGFFFNDAVTGSVQIYSCSQTLANGKIDRFMSISPTCENKTVDGSLGYLLTGSPLSSYYTTVLNRQTSWKYTSTLTTGWNTTSFDDASWNTDAAPFGGSRYTKFAPKLVELSFPFPSVFYFRRNFTIPSEGPIKMAYLFLAADNWATVYFNGVEVDSESKTHGEAQYWSRYIKIPVDLLNVGGDNLVAVALTSHDMTGWYFYDAEVKVYYDTGLVIPTPKPTVGPTTPPTFIPTSP